MPAKLLLEVTYQEVARRLLLKQSEEDIGQAMGISQAALRGILARNDFKDIFRTLQQKMYDPIDAQLVQQGRNLKDEIEQACFDSFDRLMLLLKNSSSEAIAKDVAQDMLDRGGFGKKHEETRTVINIGALEASVLVEALRKEDEGRKRLDGRSILQLTKPVDEHATDRRNESDRTSN